MSGYASFGGDAHLGQMRKWTITVLILNDFDCCAAGIDWVDTRKLQRLGCDHRGPKRRAIQSEASEYPKFGKQFVCQGLGGTGVETVDMLR